MNIKDIVKDNIVKFERLRQGNAYYMVIVKDDQDNFAPYEFPVPLSDIGDATLLKEDKAILFMRYIRKALEEGTFSKIIS